MVRAVEKNRVVKRETKEWKEAGCFFVIYRKHLFDKVAFKQRNLEEVRVNHGEKRFRQRTAVLKEYHRVSCGWCRMSNQLHHFPEPQCSHFENGAMVKDFTCHIELL